MEGKNREIITWVFLFWWRNSRRRLQTLWLNSWWCWRRIPSPDVTSPSCLSFSVKLYQFAFSVDEGNRRVDQKEKTESSSAWLKSCPPLKDSFALPLFPSSSSSLSYWKGEDGRRMKPSSNLFPVVNRIMKGLREWKRISWDQEDKKWLPVVIHQLHCQPRTQSHTVPYPLITS